MAAAPLAGDVQSMLPAAQCQRLMANEMLVVAPDHGLIWCPNAKVGTTTWYEILRRKLMPQTRSMPRCFPSACPATPVAGAAEGTTSSAAQGTPASAAAAAAGASYPLALPKRMLAAERVRLCDRRRFVSFTFIRNPWDRLASAYLSKIDRGAKVRDKQARHVQDQIRALFGLRSGAHITFGHFVRWVVQQNASTMNPHWRPHSLRCDTLYTPYEFIGRYETLQEDILHVLGMLGWSPSLVPAAHYSSVAQRWSAASRLASNRTERMLRLYQTPQLVELVARKYRDDIVPFGYTFPGRKPDV